MKKFVLKDHIPLLISLCVGIVAIAAGIGVYCGLYFSSPNYLWIKNNKVVIDLDNYDSDGNINKDKFYTFEDEEVFTATSNDLTKDLYINLDSLEDNNSNYSSFSLSINIDLKAQTPNLDASTITSNAKLTFSYINDSDLETTIASKEYNRYPTSSYNFSYTFNKTDEVKELHFVVEGNLYKDEEVVTGVYIDTNSFYFSLLGV